MFCISKTWVGRLALQGTTSVLMLAVVSCGSGSSPCQQPTLLEIERRLEAEPASLGPTWVVPGEALSGSEEEWGQAYATWILDGRSIAGVRPGLRQMLGRERDPERKARLVRALVVVGDGESVLLLTEIAGSQSEEITVRTEAIGALPSLGGRDPNKTGTRRAVKLLMQLSISPSERSELRAAAVEALGNSGDSAVIGLLGTLLLKDDDVDVRTAACIALGHFASEDEQALLYLQKGLEDGNEQVRANAAQWLDLVQVRSRSPNQ